MKIRYKGKIYNIHWLKIWDKIILKAGKKYKRSNGISWMEAEADGALRELPKCLTRYDISKRHTALKQRANPEWKKKKLKQNAEYRIRKGQYGYNEDRINLFKSLPDDIKNKHGWKSKSKWSDRQRKILEKLVEKYRKSALAIDWIKLAQDKKARGLPGQDPFPDSFTLCKYYHACKRLQDPEYIKKRRKDALDYKHNNYKEYRKNQEKRRNAIKNSVNEFLVRILNQ